MSLSASRHGLRCDSTTQRPVDESPRDARSACFALARPAGSMTAACSSPALEMRCHRHAAREQPSLARIWPVWCGPPRGERPRFMDDAARYDERVTTCGDVVAKYIVYPIACARGVLPLSSSTSLHGSVAVSSGCRGDPTRPRSAIREERERSRRVKSGYSIVLIRYIRMTDCTARRATVRHVYGKAPARPSRSTPSPARAIVTAARIDRRAYRPQSQRDAARTFMIGRLITRHATDIGSRDQVQGEADGTELRAHSGRQVIAHTAVRRRPGTLERLGHARPRHRLKRKASHAR